VSRPLITLLTDFGTADSYVDEVKAALLRAAPQATLVDLTHAVPPGDLRAAAYLLGRTWHRFPEGTVHLAVVDPGVGTPRAALAFGTAGHWFVGPDNGLFTPVLRDAAVEIVCISKRVYAYSQVPEFGSIFVGQYNQFPLLWESGLATSMMIAASIMVYRDDTGRTQAEKLAQRVRLLPTRPALASFLVMFMALSLSYLAVYGGGFLFIRAAKLSTSVACPWPFPETKVYDPQGFYEKAGHPGPFFEGKWNTWLSGQPDGRPTLDGPVEAGRCGPGRD